ncbi:MAG: hypothetical protein AAGH88_09125 [Planctomycetota bacterium]
MPQATTPSRSTAQKLTLFRGCFSGRTDAYGTYDPATGRVRAVKAKVTRQVLLDHLRGRQPYGVYLLTGDTTRAAAIDFDHDDLNPVRECVGQARHYGLQGYVERSKRKGYHVWFFFQGLVPAIKARRVLSMLLDDIGQPGVEVFPKQDAIDPGKQMGNFINAPLFGGHVRHGRTVFLDPTCGWKPAQEQWQVLADVKRIPEQHLDELIEINDLMHDSCDRAPSLEIQEPRTAKTHGLPPCAINILRDGVRENQRVCAFRLAVHWHRFRVPQYLAIAMLREWAQRNKPSDGKRIITDAEIAEQVGHGYSGRYRGYGCDDPIIAKHCDDRCPMRRGNNQAST